MASTCTTMKTERMTTVDIVRKCLFRIEKNEQNAFAEKTALVSGTYKGTRTSLAIAFGNITAKANFCQYGLSNNIAKILKHIVDLFDDEMQLMNAMEIVVVHGEQVLIRIKRDDITNTDGSILVVDVDHVMKSNLDEKTRCCPHVVCEVHSQQNPYKSQPCCVISDVNRNLKMMVYFTLSYWLLGWVKDSLSK